MYLKNPIVCFIEKAFDDSELNKKNSSWSDVSFAIYLNSISLISFLKMTVNLYAKGTLK